MGMFDNILIEKMDLPNLPWEKIGELQKPRKIKIEGVGEFYEDHHEAPEICNTVFQTKSLDSSLSTYVLKSEGLFDRRYQREEVPPEERPYYGTREWEEGDEEYRENPNHFLAFLYGPEHYQEYGKFKIVGYQDLNIHYHGDLTFYASHKDLDLPKELANRYTLVEYIARLDQNGLVRVYKPSQINPHRVYAGSYTMIPYERNEN